MVDSSHGDIEIELWSKQAPTACRNFVQHCFDGYYDNCTFHRSPYIMSIAMSKIHQSKISAAFSIDVYMDRQSDQGLHGTDG
jgi:cyclophilin family peptidyl-prolyl cis-trans isomerase